MTGVAAGGSAAIIAAQIAATRASGLVVHLEPAAFAALLARQETPLVVHSSSHFLSFTKHRYLTSYRGLGFTCESKEPLVLPANSEVIEARKIWAP